MEIETVFTWQDMVHHQVTGKTCIVIDVLRATSTITAALLAGATKVIPQNEISAARTLALQYPGSLLCGERGGLLIEGFQLGNSPLAYKPEVVSGKTLITTTTNGTNAILACQGGSSIFLGSLNNAWAVAERAAAKEQDILILCSGTRGNPSYDDMLAAGSIVYRLQQLHSQATYLDSCFAVLAIYEKERANLYQGVLLSSHSQLLAQLSMAEDVAYCSQENITHCVPVYHDGVITLL